MIEIPHFSPDYIIHIRKLWSKFQKGEDISGMLRPVIYESWARCKHQEVPIMGGEGKDVPSDEMEMLTDEEEELIQITEPIMDRIHAMTKSFSCRFVLANSAGISLRTWTGKDASLTGYHLREEYMGTAGIATCLKTKKGVIVYGAEHYCLPKQDMACVAFPIFLSSGKMIGAIGISSKVPLFHPYCIPLLEEAAQSIAEQARLRQLFAMEKNLIESIEEGLLVVDPKGKIIRSNKKAKQMLNLPEPEGREVSSIFRTMKSSPLNQETSFRNEEVMILTNGNKKEVYCVLSLNASSEGSVLTMRPASEMHKYAAKTIVPPPQYHFKDIIGSSRQIQETVQLAQKIASNNFPVLLLGESGTGKELFAQSIHNASNRQNESFIAVNCGALPQNLIQSELFGYVEGAFTGASRRGNPGKFELADKGTIFLDELGEMPLDAQVTLLRLLQSGEVIRLGGHMAQHVDVRIIAATNRDLRQLIHEGKFREDLFYRLNVFTINIPPLRKRLEDIPELVNYFLKKISTRNPQFESYLFSHEGMEFLQAQKWYGNIRELEHCVERATFMSPGNIIQLDTLKKVIRQEDEYTRTLLREFPIIQEKASAPHEAPASMPSAFSPDNDWSKMQEAELLSRDVNERTTICTVLADSNGNVEKAAAILGVSRTTLYTKLTKYNISAKAFKKLQKVSTAS